MEQNNEQNAEGLNDADRMYDLLCRYVFGEATEAEQGEVEAALATSEELRAQKIELDATVSLVQGAMGAPASGQPETLSTDRMAELTAAAAGATSSGASPGASSGASPDGAPGGNVIQGSFGGPAMKFAAAAVVLAMAGGVYVLSGLGGQAETGTWGDETTTEFLAMEETEKDANEGAPAPEAEVLVDEVYFEEQVVALDAATEQVADSAGRSLGVDRLSLANESLRANSAPLAGEKVLEQLADAPTNFEIYTVGAAAESKAPKGGTRVVGGVADPGPTGPSSPGPGFPSTPGMKAGGPGTGGPTSGGSVRGISELTTVHEDLMATAAKSRPVILSTKKVDRRDSGSAAGAPAISSGGGAYTGPGNTAPPAPALERVRAREGRGGAGGGGGVGGAAAPVPDTSAVATSPELLGLEAVSTASGSDDFFLGRGETTRKIDIRPLPGERPRDMFFRFYGDNPYVATRNDKLSTFAADVDTASFSLARRMLKDGYLPTRAQIRTEEFVNFAKPDVAPPTEGTFAVRGELAPSPFGGAEDRWLLRVGVRARDIDRASRPPLALTFVVDTSGSMKDHNRLELVKHALRLLVSQLDSRDTIAIVGFSKEAHEVLQPTPANDVDSIETALFGLQPDGGTNAEIGLRLGYEVASRVAPVESAQRRVVFLSDGVANLGNTDQDRIAEDVKRFAEGGIFLNTIGVGMSNHNDVFLEQLANRGEGVCDYVGDAKDARRAIVERFISGFVTVAKNVKIQVEFDGDAVLRYRQLGYENRAVRDADFRNDAVDAGEIGAGHQVTCFYEVQLASGVAAGDAPLAKVRLRWTDVDAGDGKTLIISKPGTTETQTDLSYESIVAPSFRGASVGFRRGALAAQLAELLRGSYHARGDSLDVLKKGLANLLTDDPSDDSAAVAECAKISIDLGLKAPPLPMPNDSDADRRAAYYRSLIESLGGADKVQDLGEDVPLIEYEERIRELIQGDQEKKPH